MWSIYTSRRGNTSNTMITMKVEACCFVPEFTFCPNNPADHDRDANFDQVLGEYVHASILQ
jgi:hypothetical protein